MIDTVASVVAAAAGVLAVLGIPLAIIRWRLRPQLICGVLPAPWEVDQRDDVTMAGLGKPSVMYAFRHRDTYLATRLKRDSEWLCSDQRADLRGSPSCRLVTPSDAGCLDLPILLSNKGRNAARDYVASVSFHRPCGQPLRLRKVLTETLRSYAYVAEPALYSANHGSCIDPKIVASYRSYQYAATEDGDTVWLWGELNAHAYEWCVVSLELDAGIEEFYLVFSLTYLGRFLTPPVYIQACRVDTKRDRVAG